MRNRINRAAAPVVYRGVVPFLLFENVLRTERRIRLTIVQDEPEWDLKIVSKQLKLILFLANRVPRTQRISHNSFEAVSSDRGGITTMSNETSDPKLMYCNQFFIE